ncbi:MAG: TetR/AcrR family transcriptional regulator [Bacteroidales bacterium]|nr:TetR/AcrR family transcriptional regulator [Candidatus Cryptobacteroides aphodequi]
MTKEQEILIAAEEVFFQNGYDASSTVDIAKRAGVTHAMVNYYFRSKEKLFIQILDNHVNDILGCLKPVMKADGDILDVAVDAADAIFDKMNEMRRFPYLLSDISRTHPDFLTRYKEVIETICSESIKMHQVRLEKRISECSVVPCTMNDIYSTVLSLATAPFMMLPMLENVGGRSEEQISTFLSDRKEEMARILRARYSVKSSQTL